MSYTSFVVVYLLSAFACALLPGLARWLYRTRLISNVEHAYRLSHFGLLGWLVSMGGIIGCLVLSESKYPPFLTLFFGLPFIVVLHFYTKRRERLERFRLGVKRTMSSSVF